MNSVENDFKTTEDEKTKAKMPPMIKINSEESFLLEPPPQDEDRPIPTLIYSSLAPEARANERRRSTVNLHDVSVFKKSTEVTLTCKNCLNKITTVTETTYAVETFFWFSFFFCCGGIFCSWIPFILSDLKRTRHICPSCRNKLGSYQPNYRIITKLVLTVLSIFCAAIATFLLLVGVGVIVFTNS